MQCFITIFTKQVFGQVRSIVVLFCILMSSLVVAQKSISTSHQLLPIDYLTSTFTLSGSSLEFTKSEALPSLLSILEPAKFKKQDLALFCRFEHTLKEQFRVPIKIRLGSVDYVDRMEGKIKNH